ncbi:MAG: OmpH family outer membrane protein [Bacteroidales bacterium]
MAYLEINQVVERYDGIKDALLEFEKEKVVWVTNIDTLQTELQNDIADYEKNGQSLPVKERIAIENELQQKRQELMKYSNVVQDKIRSKQLGNYSSCT